jgi:hypothetical protein
MGMQTSVSPLQIYDEVLMLPGQYIHIFSGGERRQKVMDLQALQTPCRCILETFEDEGGENKIHRHNIESNALI